MEPCAACAVIFDRLETAGFPSYSTAAMTAAAMAAAPAIQPQRGTLRQTGGCKVWGAAQLRAMRHASPKT